MTTKSIIILPNQLFAENKLIENGCKIFIYEHPVFMTMYKYHKMKLILHRATMKYYEDYLKEKYDKFECKIKYVKYNENFDEIIKNTKEIMMYDPVDFYVLDDIMRITKKYKINLKMETSPLFICTTDELNEYNQIRANKNKVRQHDFYIWQRKRLDILMQGKTPIKGKWSFDILNRNKFPEDFKEIKMEAETNAKKYIEEATEYVNKNFSKNIGGTELYLPITHKTAKKHFKTFLITKLKCFGKYQDAISENIKFGCHSVISPLLNIGLIDIRYVVEATLKFYEKNKTLIKIESVEGFLRQIIGWREYVRYVYVSRHKELIERNFFNHNKKFSELKPWFNGTTGIYPVDVVIKKIVETGYAHHIERLMILGNFMLLNQIQPKIIHDWFQMMFIDSYHVFMEPNVYGMSQYSVGDMMMTKPYFSSSNYIFKMSDYRKNDERYSIIKVGDKEFKWFDIWNLLYYFFIYNNQNSLKKNYFTAMYVKQWTRLSVDEKQNIIKYAKKYLA